MYSNKTTAIITAVGMLGFGSVCAMILLVNYYRSWWYKKAVRTASYFLAVGAPPFWERLLSPNTALPAPEDQPVVRLQVDPTAPWVLHGEYREGDEWMERKVTLHFGNGAEGTTVWGSARSHEGHCHIKGAYNLNNGRFAWEEGRSGLRRKLAVQCIADFQADGTIGRLCGMFFASDSSRGDVQLAPEPLARPLAPRPRGRGHSPWLSRSRSLERARPGAVAALAPTASGGIARGYPVDGGRASIEANPIMGIPV